jgi:hypothetical protein
MIRKMVRASLGACVCLLLASPAVATFHLMKIVEVFPGTGADPMAQYVMLQMYFPGQNFVGGHSLTIYDASGTKVGTFTFPGSVANGANLATILIATSDADALFGVTADLMMTPVTQAAGGAACWDVVDCVAWGSFSAAASLPASAGTPFNAPTGLVPDMAMHRDLSSGGSVTAFAFAPPAPKNNAGQVGTVPTPNATPTPTPLPAGCAGDCNGDAEVTVNEVLLLVNVALGNTSVADCEVGDLNGDGTITVNEILAAVNNALNGCPHG